MAGLLKTLVTTNKKIQRL